jgi:uncharacterized membrane protein YeiH
MSLLRQLDYAGVAPFAVSGALAAIARSLTLPVFSLPDEDPAKPRS